MGKKMNNNQNNGNFPEFDDLQKNLSKIDELTKRLVISLANKKQDTNFSQPNQDLYYKAASKYFSEMLSNPSKLIENQIKFYKSTLEIWSSAQRDFLNNDNDMDTDEWALDNGYISIVPTQYDLTDHNMIQTLKKWNL